MIGVFSISPGRKTTTEEDFILVPETGLLQIAITSIGLTTLTSFWCVQCDCRFTVVKFENYVSILQSFSISTSEALELMDQFCLMNPDSNGLVKFRGFCTVFGLGDNLPSKKIFTYLDVERRGSIAFRQFLIGSAHVRKQPLFMRACETAFNTFCDSESSCSTLTIEQFRDKLQSMMPSTDKESLNQLVHLFDVDEDGKIDRDDFMSCLWKNPLLVALFPALIDTTILAVHA
ncbi:lysophospholipid acyltransferase LPEAT2-like [Phalaenopsis equestris]|uniref:lysophospholipid acyltransferase LPEAT2-like n=1 Tax=Phalaenopsis equestris TaxID=78828 RepID=UPI0009E3A22F|nr:lysophospholipid acyltransferase LPEAT2-like [Phalaenopsis equestris]